jgi:hypothetical protein
MRRSSLVLAAGVLWLASGACLSSDGSKATELEWEYHPVGTPYLPNEPKIGKPSFVQPAPISVVLPRHVPCAPKDAFGEYEAFVSEEGRVTSVTSHHEPIDGNQCQRKYIFPVIKRWRFKPATFEGKATPVYMWIGVNTR